MHGRQISMNQCQSHALCPGYQGNLEEIDKTISLCGENIEGDVKRDDSQRRILAQCRVATFRMATTLFQHCNAELR